MNTQVLICVSDHGFTKNFLAALQESLGRLKLQAGQFAETTHGPFSVIRMRLTSHKLPSSERIKTVLSPIESANRVDIFCNSEESFKTPMRLIAFDMDSTLIQAEVIDEMARAHGVLEKVKQITDRAMNGEMDFDHSLRERLSLLKGLKREKLESIYSQIQFTDGTEEFIKRAHAHGIKTAIISGGFSFFANKFKDRLGMHHAFANELDFDGDELSGKVVGEILNASKKVQLLQELSLKETVSIEQIVAVGDGANDIPMLNAAGIGIAIHGKAKVRLLAPHLINHNSMLALLFYLGLSYGDV